MSENKTILSDQTVQSSVSETDLSIFTNKPDNKETLKEQKEAQSLNEDKLIKFEDSEYLKEVSYCYVLCLIDWAGKTLSSREYDDFLKNVNERIKNTKNNSWEKVFIESSDGIWSKKVIPLTTAPPTAELSIIPIQGIEVAYYHSRLIFEIKIRTPKNIKATRKLRGYIQNWITEFLTDTVAPSARTLRTDYSESPIIFAYPLFRCDNLLKEEEGNHPFTARTAAFYTELDDKPHTRAETVKGKKVKLRISGAQIIASLMSGWFFDNLVNAIFHEGLYRQASQREFLAPKKLGDVYFGLESMLGEFAGKLLQLFNGYSNEVVRKRWQITAVLISVIVGSCTIANIFYGILT